MIFEELDSEIKSKFQYENEQIKYTKGKDFINVIFPTVNIKSEADSVILSNNKKKYQKFLDKGQSLWPDILKINYHDVYYNLDSSCEELEANIINLVKFDTISSFWESRITSTNIQNKTIKNMFHYRQKKRDICELLFTSPERNKMYNQNIQQTKKLKIVRSDLMPTTEIRQISVGKQNKKKTVKGCIKTDFTYTLENPSCVSTNEKSIDVSKSCRKQLFVNHSISNGYKGKQNSGNSTIISVNQHMPLGWSIKKNRPAAVIKPVLSLKAEKYFSLNEENKQKLSLRKGIQRTKFMNTDSNTSSEFNESSSVGLEKSLKHLEEKRLSFNSESSEDLSKDRELELPLGELSERHKKKLREAVANALEKQNITLDHPSFKIYGRNLFSLCKIHLKDVIGKGRTSVQMKILAENYVEQVISQEAKKL